MELLITIVLGAIGSLLAAEIWANAPRLGRWFIKRAVLQLPASKRDHFLEEWLSDIDERPGALDKLRHALGCYFRAARVLAAEEKLTPEAEQAILKFVFKVYVRVWTLPRAVPLIIRGKFISVKMMWRMIEFIFYVSYMHKEKFGGTSAELKAILERCERNLANKGEKTIHEARMDYLRELADAVQDARKRRVRWGANS